MKHKNLSDVVIDNKNGSRYSNPGRTSCCQIVWEPSNKTESRILSFCVYKSEISPLTADQVNNYIKNIQKSGWTFECEEETYGWNIQINYADYKTARQVYILFILLRYLWCCAASKKIITKTEELKEKTKYKWFKCLQLAHIWKQENVGNTLYSISRLPIKLLDFEELTGVISDTQSLNPTLSSNVIFENKNVQELKKVIKLVKDNEEKTWNFHLFKTLAIEKKVDEDVFNAFLKQYGVKLIKQTGKWNEGDFCYSQNNLYKLVRPHNNIQYWVARLADHPNNGEMNICMAQSLLINVEKL